ERQLMMFSATISRETEAIAKEIMKEPEVIRGGESITVPAVIDHIYFVAEQRDKIEVLRKLVRILSPEKAIVFVNKSDEIEVNASKLKYHGLAAEAIHGSSIKRDRKKTMEEFRNGKIQLLVASDLAARGLDIEGVTHVFNLSMPEDPKDYLHRVGRTGRKGNTGTAVSIVTDRELTLIKKYEKVLKIKIDARDMYKGNIIEARKTQKRDNIREKSSYKIKM
ncbi:MAG: DEAD/DEAH box helicase, partial [Bacteroidota bacterium]|nr:DEAD/DEAH box helicase [Bacteroidota bacterium]